LLSPLDDGLAALVGAVPYASSAEVTFAYQREQIRHRLDGFGFVVPAVERLPLLACTFSSVKFEGRAPAGRVLLRAFLGGALRPDALDGEDASLVAAAEDALRPLLGISGRPHLVRVHRHSEAMPQYLVGHLGRVEQIEARAARHPALALAGNTYRGVGIPDCVRSGEAAAERVLEDCASAPLTAVARAQGSKPGS
jgi:oxygen-dependent protoporphyrinogen oxidase